MEGWRLISLCCLCLQNRVLHALHDDHGHQVVERTLQLICMWLLKNGVKSVRHVYCLKIFSQMTDVFSKYTQAIPTKDQRASTVAEVLVKHWF